MTSEEHCPLCAARPTDQDTAFERMIEDRVAARLETEAWHWRFRLLSIESLMMGTLVLAAGLLLRQPVTQVLRATLIVTASCFASGILLLSLSTGTGKLLTRFRRWRAS